MSFKEDVEQDVMEVFLNEDEFAEMHQINGMEMPAVVTEISEERRSRDRDTYERAVHNRRKTLSVAENRYGKMPAVNSLLMLDGKGYLVKDASDEMGMYKITLEVART